MLPSTENLRCFSEAARLLNFRAAARSIALTPAALGQRIRQLEEQVGTKLFHRTTRTVVLTQAGLALVPRARAALQAAEACLRVGDGASHVPAELVVGTRFELGLSWILPEIPRLEEEHPGLTLHLYVGSATDLLTRVRSLEIDCAVGSMRLTDPKLDSVRLHPENYVFVAHPALLRRTPLRTDADAARHTLVDVHSDLPLFGYWRDAPGGGDRLRFGRIRTMGTIEAVRRMLLDQLGVGVLPEYLVAADLRRRRLARVFPEVALLSDYFRLVFRADDPRRSLIESLGAGLRRAPLR